MKMGYRKGSVWLKDMKRERKQNKREKRERIGKQEGRDKK